MRVVSKLRINNKTHKTRLTNLLQQKRENQMLFSVTTTSATAPRCPQKGRCFARKRFGREKTRLQIKSPKRAQFFLFLPDEYVPNTGNPPVRNCSRKKAGGCAQPLCRFTADGNADRKRVCAVFGFAKLGTPIEACFEGQVPIPLINSLYKPICGVYLSQ